MVLLKENLALRDELTELRQKLLGLTALRRTTIDEWARGR